MKILSILILFLCLNSAGIAKDKKEINEVSLGYGSSSKHMDIYRVSIKKDLNKYFFERRYNYLPQYYETTLSYWKGHGSGSIKSISFSPMYRYDFGQYYESIPFIEAGVGISYASDVTLEGEDFGTHFQFENSIGFGFKFSEFDIAYRYVHYSNAGLDDNNSGADFSIISISFKF